MESTESTETETLTCIRTLRLKVKSEAYPWLKAAATHTAVADYNGLGSELGIRREVREPFGPGVHQGIAPFLPSIPEGYRACGRAICH